MSALKTKTRHYPRWIVEAINSQDATLKIDQDAGIIYGVKILGRYSKNCHGIQGVTEGTEYTAQCLRDALPLYEGATVYCNHDRAAGDGARNINDTFGTLRNVRVSEHADELRGDLHYLKANPMAPRVVEDVLRGLGVFGLSHNAFPEKASVREAKYVIDKLESVRSVDLVDKPATNKNLAESREKTMKTTFKAMLTEALKNLSAGRKKVGKQLLEMDDMPLNTDVEVPEDDADPLTTGFKAAMMAVLDDDTLDAAAKLAKLKVLLTTHEKLTGDAEPVDEADDMTDKADDKDKATVESLQKKIRDLEAKDTIRTLCESEGFTPSPVLFKSLLLLESTADRKALIAEHKATKPSAGGAKSGPPPRKSVTESSEIGDVKDVKSFAALIRG